MAKFKRLSYQKSDKVISKMSEPNLDDVWTVDWDRPDFTMQNAARLFDSKNHQIPRGDGMVRRKSGRKG